MSLMSAFARRTAAGFSAPKAPAAVAEPAKDKDAAAASKDDAAVAATAAAAAAPKDAAKDLPLKPKTSTLKSGIIGGAGDKKPPSSSSEAKDASAASAPSSSSSAPAPPASASAPTSASVAADSSSAASSSVPASAPSSAATKAAGATGAATTAAEHKHGESRWDLEDPDMRQFWEWEEKFLARRAAKTRAAVEAETAALEGAAAPAPAGGAATALAANKKDSALTAAAKKRLRKVAAKDPALADKLLKFAEKLGALILRVGKAVINMTVRLVRWLWALALNPASIRPKLAKLWKLIVHEAKHYWHGTKLLAVDVRIASGLIVKRLQGHQLTRRESRQLTRTTGDILRLVPFAVIVLVPFLELALPLLLKLFPNMLPSTYQAEADVSQKARAELKARMELAEILEETLEATARKKAAAARAKRVSAAMAAEEEAEELAAESLQQRTVRAEAAMQADAADYGGLPAAVLASRNKQTIEAVAADLAAEERLAAAALEKKRLEAIAEEAARAREEEEEEEEADEEEEAAERMLEVLDAVRSGEHVSNEQIIAVAALFQDNITLDRLSRQYLVAICRYMKINTYGTDEMLRQRLHKKVEEIREDDTVIEEEGIENLTLAELKEACRDRGMRSFGLTLAGYRANIEQWIDLSVHKQVPASLLLLSRALSISERPTSESLKEALSSLDDEAIHEALADAGLVDDDTEDKLEAVLRENEQIAAEARAAEEKKAAKEAAKEAAAKGAASQAAATNGSVGAKDGAAPAANAAAAAATPAAAKAAAAKQDDSA